MSGHVARRPASVTRLLRHNAALDPWGRVLLHLHRADRADRLVDVLASVLADPGADPLAPEIVAVPTRGVERWLTQRLSGTLGTSAGRADGVCANVAFPFPGRLVGAAVASATGVERDADPWLPERAVWPLLEVVDAGLDDAWLAPLAAHLGHSRREQAGTDDAGRGARRFGVVRHLADLFDRYGVHRPTMLRDWAAGQDTDGTGLTLPADAVWQAALWRRLRDRLEVASPAERLHAACERLVDDPGVSDLPDRLSLFGLTRLPASYLDVLQALAENRAVHLFLLHPSPVLWERVQQAAPPQGGSAPAGGDPAIWTAPLPRRDDPTATLPGNPLLANWGRDAREMQLVLRGEPAATTGRHHVGEPGPTTLPVLTTLLGRIQEDVRADRAVPGSPLPGSPDERMVHDPRDRSVQVHACHGRVRQVEVLRDAILHLLADDPTLEPRDIVVMCPDIDAFAPLIHATFGTGGEAEPDYASAAGERRPDLRVRLADRSLRQTNPVLAVVAEVLSLAQSRLTASQVTDLAGREPVARRFSFSDDDLSRLEEWVAASGVRWGLDAEHRRPYKLEKVAANTWQAGLDRVLVGVAMSEDDLRLVGGVLPLDDVGSGDIDLAGRFGEFVNRLHRAVTDLQGPMPIAAWADAIAAAAESLTAVADQDTWQTAQLQRMLDDVVTAATVEARPSEAPLALGEIEALLADRLRGRPTRANFRTGHLTICTMVPMRSVPHRVVCLLGLDDGVFPRRTAPEGDDLLAANPCVGDRDPRSEDRQLILDALMAATDHLVITYAGRDERTNGVLPPAVPVGELLEVIDRTARTEEVDDGPDVPVSERVVVHHPLQPFDHRNFSPGALAGDGPWSFDEVALDGARAAVSERAPAEPFLTEPLPPDERDLIELDDLVRFLEHPARAFLRQRLGIVLRDGDEELADALPVELDGLQRWGIGDRMLRARLSGATREAARAAELARQLLPPGELGMPVLDGVAREVEEIVGAAVPLVGDDARPGAVEIGADLGDARWLAGTVPGVFGDLLRPVTYSRLKAKQRLAAWARLLALTATDPKRPFALASVGKAPRGRRVRRITIAPLGPDPETRRRTALDHLRVLVDCYERGMREPLPLYTETSCAYAEAVETGREAVYAAEQRWTSRWRRDRFSYGEDRELEHQFILGGTVRFEDLIAEPPGADEVGEAWPDEASRFGCYACRLWLPLLAREEVA